MDQFTAKYAGNLIGTLNGFDRLLFAGTLRALSYAEGMANYLKSAHVRLLDFKTFCAKTTTRVRKASEESIRSAGRQVLYLNSCQESKEERARAIAKEEGITQGPICMFSCVEPCRSFSLRGNPATQKLELRLEQRKCVHLYLYAFHRLFGFMYARLQTWFPFGIQVYINGHEWLARQMDSAGLAYRRQGNCFVEIEDLCSAQALYDAQLKTDWVKALDELGKQIHPLQEELLASFKTSYYWSTRESEWSSDLLFEKDAHLTRLYPRLVEHAMVSFSSGDVLRFLGKRIRQDGRLPPSFEGEVTSDLKTRQEGLRVKHWVNHNSVKMYDKAHATEGFGGGVLRVETTIYNESEFRVFRPKEGANESEQDKQWRVMRRGVADLYLRAQVSQQANNRYLNALASADQSLTLGECLEPILHHTEWHGKRVRALRPFDPDDMDLLKVVGRAEFVINGMRNRDLQSLLYSGAAVDAQESRRHSGCITRKLRLLRAHGLIEKVPHTHRYLVTQQGRQILTALLAARQTPICQLFKAAA